MNSKIVLKVATGGKIIIPAKQSPSIKLNVASRGPAGKNGVGLPFGGADGQLVIKDGTDPFVTKFVTPTKSLVGLSLVDNTADLDKPLSTAAQTALSGKLSLTGGTITGAVNMTVTGTGSPVPITINMADSTPGIPATPSEGIFRVVGGDGTTHMAFFKDLDGDGDYDADIHFTNNGYIVFDNNADIRTGKTAKLDEFGDPVLDINGNPVYEWNGRLRIKYESDVNYIQSGRRYNGEAPFNDLAITHYNSSFGWAFFDQDRNGYMAVGWPRVAGTYVDVPARLTVRDGANRLGQFLGLAASGKAEVNIRALDTTNDETNGIMVIANHFFLKANDAYSFQLNANGFYVGGNLTTTDGSGHITVQEPTARVDIRTVSTALIPQMRIRSSSTIPTNELNDGAIWNQSNSLKIIQSGVTQTFAMESYVNAAVATLATDSAVVHNTGTESIAGAKTFTSTITVSSTFTASGAIKNGTNTRTSNTTLTSTTVPVNSIDASGGNVTITLPTAVGNNGLRFYLKRIDNSGNTVTIATTSSQTIDGSTTHSMPSQWDKLHVISNNANWIIL